jgi:hypothetical protein
MRIIGRTLAILAAAMIVVGITFGFTESSGASALAPARPAHNAEAQSQSADGTIDASTAGRTGLPAGEFGHGHNRSASLFGAVEIVKNLVIIGIIVALVALAKRMAGGRRPKGGPDQPCDLDWLVR